MSAARKILVVDDDRDIRETMVEALEGEGYDVVSAVDGVDALEQLRSVEPHVILLDLMMPRMNGREFWEAISSSAAWGRIPIVVISADAQGRTQAEEMGAAAYLRKPMRLAELFHTVADVVAKD